jgi:DNA polymerase III subunit gamma/tau
MSDVLYRKYRSKTFAEIIGQEAIVRVLRRAISDSKIAHAYLFTGPRGTGKTSTARIVAKAVNCLQHKDGEPCNKCSICKSVTEGNFIDLIEIDAASNRGIDEIRDLKEKVSFLPAEGKYKVYIIDEVHMLTMEAFNALLKTLEEPPPQVIFILATTEAHKLPLTIISRTQRFDFKTADGENLVKKLNLILKKEKIEFEPEGVELIAKAGNGSYRDAETILEKVLASSGYKQDKVINKEDVENILGFAANNIVEELYKAILSENVQKSLELMSDANQQGVNLSQFARQLLEMAREDMINILAGKSKGKSNLGLIASIIKEFSSANNQLNTALIPSLPFEVAIFNLIGSSDQRSIDQGSSVQVTSQGNIHGLQNKDLSVENEKHKLVNRMTNKEVQKVKQSKQSKSDSNSKSNTIAENSESKSSKSINKTNNNKNEANDLDLQKFIASWPLVIQEAKVLNHNLAAFMTRSRPVKIDDDVVLLEVKFALHKKKLEESKTQDFFEQASEKLLGKKLKLKCKIVKEDKKDGDNNSKSNTELVEGILL